MWHVYMVRCADGTIYTGSTTDPDRRLDQHNSSKAGARYTRGRRPVRLVYQRECGSRRQAAAEEIRIKKLSRRQKMELMTADA